MKSALLSWQLWAVLSACFAALTAIFAKVGIENVNSDFATFIRTIVILCALAAILAGTGQWQSPGSVSTRSYWFLVLSGLATEVHGYATFAPSSWATRPASPRSTSSASSWSRCSASSSWASAFRSQTGWGSPLSPPALSSLPTNRRRTGSAQSRQSSRLLAKSPRSSNHRGLKEPP